MDIDFKDKPTLARILSVFIALALLGLLYFLSDDAVTNKIVILFSMAAVFIVILLSYASTIRSDTKSQLGSEAIVEELRIIQKLLAGNKIKVSNPKKTNYEKLKNEKDYEVILHHLKTHQAYEGKIVIGLFIILISVASAFFGYQNIPTEVRLGLFLIMTIISAMILYIGFYVSPNNKKKLEEKMNEILEKKSK